MIWVFGDQLRAQALGYRGDPNVPDHLCRRNAEALCMPEPDSVYLQQIPRKFHVHSVKQAWRGVLMRDGWKYVCMPGQDWLLFHTKDDLMKWRMYASIFISRRSANGVMPASPGGLKKRRTHSSCLPFNRNSFSGNVERIFCFCAKQLGA
ncbi:hypothetical protein ACHHV8_14060 [Paenibacillus sp. TAB 01]|uniref:hypothetical protein n=1 Tax=Paenibacillus sp. TAB 01 TaxID=3368988 RepID=UPI00375256B7